MPSVAVWAASVVRVQRLEQAGIHVVLRGIGVGAGSWSRTSSAPTYGRLPEAGNRGRLVWTRCRVRVNSQVRNEESRGSGEALSRRRRTFPAGCPRCPRDRRAVGTRTGRARARAGPRSRRRPLVAQRRPPGEDVIRRLCGVRGWRFQHIVTPVLDALRATPARRPADERASTPCVVVSRIFGREDFGSRDL